jgi:uncharacterized protein (TIGR02147 family)
MIPSILGYLDYRSWLKDAYDSRKEETSFFSYRYMAGRLDIDAGWLVKIFQGKLQLPDRAVAGVQKLFGLQGREAEFFEELVAFSKARSRSETARSFNRLMDLKGLDARSTEDRHASFYLDWRHTVVRSLIGITSFRGDYEALGRMCDPAISAEEARQSVELLEGLDFIQRDEHNLWKLKDVHLTQGQSVPRQAVRKFQADTLRLAERALHEIHPDEREISTQTVALSHADLPLIRSWVADFWRQVQILTQNSPAPDQIYHLGMIFFPVGRTKPQKKNPGR